MLWFSHTRSKLRLLTMDPSVELAVRCLLTEPLSSWGVDRIHDWARQNYGCQVGDLLAILNRYTEGDHSRLVRVDRNIPPCWKIRPGKEAELRHKLHITGERPVSMTTTPNQLAYEKPNASTNAQMKALTDLVKSLVRTVEEQKEEQGLFKICHEFVLFHLICFLGRELSIPKGDQTPQYPSQKSPRIDRSSTCMTNMKETQYSLTLHFLPYFFFGSSSSGRGVGSVSPHQSVYCWRNLEALSPWRSFSAFRTRNL